MTRRTLTVLAALLAAVVVAAVAFTATRGDDGGSSAASDGARPASGEIAAGDVTGPPDAPAPDVDPDAATAALHQEELGKIEPTRLAEGLVPPTNRWFSGLVFQHPENDEPMPVFPHPLSAGFEGGAVTLGLPDPVTSEKAIVGPHVPAITVDAGTQSIEVVAHDDASVTVALLDEAGTAVGRVVLAEGSPFAPLTATQDLTLSVDAAFEPAEGLAPEGFAAATAEVAERTWVAVAPEGAFEGSDITLAADETVTWFPLPDEAADDAPQRLAEAATHPVTGAVATYGVGDGIARTTIGYATADGGETAYVTRPHHRQGDQPERPDCGLGTYPSVYGTLELCAGSQLTSFAPQIEPQATLDVDAIDDSERERILEQLPTDVAAVPDPPADTYFGGKWLYQAATLVTLGEQLGAEDVVADLRTEVTDKLREWTEPQGCADRDAFCFAYDPTARGVVGQVPSFGSDEFNDHHFHYGYHLAAAGLMARDDEALAEELAPVMDVLAQDIATVVETDRFPRLRNFDVYAGHSWASGTSPFRDGNNQESSSEAVNAWNGLGLWAQARGDEATEQLASWLMSTEAAAIIYWTDLDLEDPVYEGYGQEIVTLNWGGKRDYATWFSAEPNAMLGILLIPMGPFADYLATAEPERIRAAVEEATPGGYGVQFGDYLLMYRALAGPEDAAAAWEEAERLPEDSIDDANSRSYMLAWIASRTG
ncbi:1,3-beta-glucanase [Actinotalea ferrariae CF5-4]|uniref:glucan endo-1,3-beta-D-glucosidase n=1 Tax=Actinotalea ferrariae CF5-4 TaxID=948458 RepID=A0A021VNP2_9CELL|nr:glycosyl hydrolase [Actinotalea ferrariae]EYR62766.1 1,3-beta-glucanase [Actinotalea ferrariae CF5-4]